MTFKNRLELLIKSIQQANPKLRIEDISTSSGYKPQTLTQSISSGKVSERMYNTVRERFKDNLSGDIQINNTNLDTQIGIIEERLIRLESYSTVLMETSVNLVSQATGKQSALVSADSPHHN